ncbi:Hypothetical predicted protein [Olea europaea subsp. europaea]|uniref:Uncharacterized protein n=1 Tax=Olea europaea subsp. europaea TaxID=158383 RepID=A0A8S0UYA8_OLEEU|nr:Hypothetical predicted protein [Olea europaea subsp. europaea]
MDATLEWVVEPEHVLEVLQTATTAPPRNELLIKGRVCRFLNLLGSLLHLPFNTFLIFSLGTRWFWKLGVMISPLSGSHILEAKEGGCCNRWMEGKTECCCRGKWLGNS